MYFKFIYIKIFVCLFLLFYAIINAYSQTKKNTKPEFNNKEAIVAWYKKPYSSVDTISYTADSLTEGLIVLVHLGSGIPFTDIHIYNRLPLKKVKWVSILERNSVHGGVVVNIDEKSKEIIFETGAGKLIMILSLEMLSIYK